MSDPAPFQPPESLRPADPLEPAPLAPPAGRRARLLRAGLAVVVAASVVAVALDLLRRFDAAQVSLHAGWLLAALVPASVAVLVQAMAWRTLLSQLSGRQVPLHDSAVVYLDSQLARYVPGKVGLLAARIAAAPRLGVKPRLMVSSLFVELLSWGGVGVLAGFSSVAATSLALPTRGGAWAPIVAEARTIALPLALVALVGLLGLCLIPRARFPSWLRSVLTATDGEAPLSAPLVPAILPFWHVLHWLCWGLAGAVLSLGLGATPSVAAFSGGVLCLAVVLGALAVVAPAGAGVREVVISVGTAPVLGPSAALVLGLAARAISLAADFACWTAVRLFQLQRERALRASARGQG